MKAYKIKDDIYFVGAIDWNLRNFHGYGVEKGSSYNAYLILDEKITLIDNVKGTFTNELIERISSLIDPSRIEVIISNHGEPDHSGSIEAIHKLAPNAKIYSSFPNGVKILNAQYSDLPIVGVKSGDTLNIGKRTLKFIHTPMVHWPDNMVTYDIEDKILFSNDIFGQHISASKLFDSYYTKESVLYEAKKYYANIVLPYTAQALKVLSVVKELEFDMVATSHGVILKDYISDVIALYDYLTTYQKQEKAVIVYDTMWGSTKVMASSIAEAFMEKGIKVLLYNVNETDKSDIITEIVDAKYLAVGSSTINNSILAPIAAFLNYIKGLSPRDLKFIAFGSYGWGGQGSDVIAKELSDDKYIPLIPPIKQYFKPTNESLELLKNNIKAALNEK